MFRHIERPSDLYTVPQMLVEMRRLASMPKEQAVEIDNFGEQFRCRPLAKSWLWNGCQNGWDYAGLAAGICWMREGPKLVHVNDYQYRCMAQVEVRLELKDFSTPYPTVLVSMPEGKIHHSVLVCQYAPCVLLCSSHSLDGVDDVCTLLRQHDGQFMEDSLVKYFDVEDDVAEQNTQTLRVAINMMLALSNYGHHARHLFPEEVQRERKYVTKGDRAGRDGRKASDRLREAPMVVALDREVIMHRTAPKRNGDATPTGREMPFHQRRGHWHTVAYGAGRTERKLVLYPPCLIRADLLGVDVSETTTVYK